MMDWGHAYGVLRVRPKVVGEKNEQYIANALAPVSLFDPPRLHYWTTHPVH